ncbi:MAG: hypothetical protein PHS41_13455 [Victivallaceae bacterium]|nr:hypothetical protein [Victivallaceae bacterium]
MRQWIFALLCMLGAELSFCAEPLRAADPWEKLRSTPGTLAVADCTPNGDYAVRELLHVLASESHGVSVSIERMSLARGLFLLEKNKVSAVLCDSADLPDGVKSQEDYAYDVLVLAAGKTFPRDDLAFAELAGLFGGGKVELASVGDALPTGVSADAARELFSKRVLKFAPVSRRVFFVPDFSSAEVLAEADPKVLFFAAGLRKEFRGKLLSVNHVLPDEPNIRNGSYPLSGLRSILFSRPDSHGQWFAKVLSGERAAPFLRGAGMVPVWKAPKK